MMFKITLTNGRFLTADTEDALLLKLYILGNRVVGVDRLPPEADTDRRVV